MDPIDRATIRRWLREHPGADRYGDPLPEGAVGRIGTLRLRHSIQGGNGWIGSASFSPDGALLAVAAKEDCRVSVWDIPSGRLRYMLNAHDHGYVWAAHFSPDGRWLVSEGHGRPWKETVALWDMSAGIRLNWLPGDAGYTPRFSPDSRLLVTAAQDGIALWDVLSRRNLRRLAPIATLPAFTSDGHLLAGAHTEGVVLWAIPGGKLRRRFSFPEDGNRRTTQCQALAVSPDGRWIAASRHASAVQEVLTEAEFKRRKKELKRCSWQFADGQVRILKHTMDITVWETATGDMMAHFNTAFVAERLACLPNSTVLLSTHYGEGRGPSHLRAWAMPSAKRCWSAHVDFNKEFSVSPDGRAVACINKGVELHDSGTGKLVREIPTLHNVRSLNKLAFSPNKGNLLAVAHHDGLIELRNTDTGEEVTPLIRHTDEIRDVVFSSDGTRIATQSYGVVILWEVDTGRELGRMTISFVDENLVCMNERFVVYAPTPPTASVWEWASRRPWPALPETIDGWATLWTGRELLAVQARDWAKPRLYSASTGEVVGELPGSVLAITNCGSVFLVPHGANQFSLWQLDPLREIGQIEVPLASEQGEQFYLAWEKRPSQAFAFSPGGTEVVCRVRHNDAYSRHGLLRWDVASGKLLSQAHFTVPDETGFGPFPSLGVREDGVPLLAIPTYSMLEEREFFSVAIWDGCAGSKVRTYAEGRDYIRSLAIDPTGKMVAATCDTTVVLWGLPQGKAKQRRKPSKQKRG
jgi:WD40 repeat protein